MTGSQVCVRTIVGWISEA